MSIDAEIENTEKKLVYLKMKNFMQQENVQPERSKREDLKKCVICDVEYKKEQVPNNVCDYCSEDSTYADSL